MAMDQAKRQKVMAAVALILALVVALMYLGKGKGGSGGGLLAKITGGDLNKLKNSYNNKLNNRNMTLQQKLDYDALETKYLNSKSKFGSYSKSGSPRGEVQQFLRNVAKNVGWEDLRVSPGYDKTVPGCEYLKMIDFSISTRKVDMKILANFMEQIDNEAVKYYWNDCKIYKSGSNLAFSATIRVYVLNNKAVKTFGRKS